MKKLIGLMIALILVLPLCGFSGQPAAEQKADNGATAESETKEENKADSSSSSAETSESTLDTESVGEAPDYSQEDCWYQIPEITKDVDTFYIYAAEYEKSPLSELSWSCL